MADYLHQNIVLGFVEFSLLLLNLAHCDVRHVDVTNYIFCLDS